MKLRNGKDYIFLKPIEITKVVIIANGTNVSEKCSLSFKLEETLMYTYFTTRDKAPLKIRAIIKFDKLISTFESSKNLKISCLLEISSFILSF